jgi:CBS domain-containing protein
MKISDVMTPNPEFCTPDSTIQECARLMAERDVGIVPICESRDTRRLVGCLTDRDLVLRVISEGRDPGHVEADEVMTQRLVTCREIDGIEEVSRLMEEHQVRRVLVVDEYFSLIGVVSTADLARSMARSKVGETLEAISQPGAPK